MSDTSYVTLAVKGTIKVEGIDYLKCMMCDGARNCSIYTWKCRCNKWDIIAQDELIKNEGKCK